LADEISILIFDCCRENRVDFDAIKDQSNQKKEKKDNLNNLYSECNVANVFIACSTSPGQLSYEKYSQKKLSQSLFTHYLLKLLDNNYSIDHIFREIKRKVCIYSHSNVYMYIYIYVIFEISIMLQIFFNIRLR